MFKKQCTGVICFLYHSTQLTVFKYTNDNYVIKILRLVIYTNDDFSITY